MRHWVVLILFLLGLGALRVVGCGDYDDEGCDVGEPCASCEGVVCPPDDNECTTERCSCGSCISTPVADGTSCTYEGLPGLCLDGVCGEDPCESLVCDDDDACTNDRCWLGDCYFSAIDCDDGDPCTADTCSSVDGCVFTAVEDGSPCGRAGYGMCDAGSCVAPCDLASDREYQCPIAGLEDLLCCPGFDYCSVSCPIPKCDGPEDCDDDNECTDERCTDGACVYTPVQDGTTCDGGEGACEAGRCVRIERFACTEQGLRDAIAAGGGPHMFDCRGPQTVVTTEEILIGKNVILDGEGNLTVDANQTHRVFFITGSTVELRGITVTGGAASEGGGGILYVGLGKLTLIRSTVSGNRAETDGGGIYALRPVVLRNSNVSDNTAARSGGGIYGGAAIAVTDSTISGNIAESRAGGISVFSTLTLTSSTVSSNTATSSGGGIYTSGPSIQVTVIDSTISGNTSGGLGGGIYGYGTLTLTKSTVSHNTATSHGGGIYVGGPVPTAMTLTNCTISQNAGVYGAALASSDVVRLIHSTISGNSGDSSIWKSFDGSVRTTGTLIDGSCQGDVYSTGYNIESPGDTCGLDPGETDLVGVPDPMLGPLQSNEGPTETHALEPGSPAINQIPAEECLDAEGAPLTTDQRGVPRPETGGTMCDVGAFERQPEDS